MIVLNVIVSDSVSVNFPVSEDHKNDSGGFAVAADTNSIGLLKPGQKCTVISRMPKALPRTRPGTIREIERNNGTLIITIN